MPEEIPTGERLQTPHQKVQLFDTVSVSDSPYRYQVHYADGRPACPPVATKVEAEALMDAFEASEEGGPPQG